MLKIENDTQLAYYLQGYLQAMAGRGHKLDMMDANEILTKVLQMHTKGPVAKMVVATLGVNETLDITANPADAGATIASRLNNMTQSDLGQQATPSSQPNDLWANKPSDPNPLRC